MISNRLSLFHRCTLQRTATHCNTLQHIATHCNTHLHRSRRATMHCVASHTSSYCSTLQRTATHCNTLQLTAPHCNSLHLTATHSFKYVDMRRCSMGWPRLAGSFCRISSHLQGPFAKETYNLKEPTIVATPYMSVARYLTRLNHMCAMTHSYVCAVDIP